MNSCELISAITALAAVMAKGRTPDEITQLAVIFTQLGDTLATIAFQQGLCRSSEKADPPPEKPQDLFTMGRTQEAS